MTDGNARYWLEKQTPAEPFVFVMYDTKNGDHARCKASFPNLSMPKSSDTRLTSTKFVRMFPSIMSGSRAMHLPAAASKQDPS